MSIQNVGGGSPEIPEYKTPDEVDFEPKDIYNSQKIGNTLAGIENSVKRDIKNALANDGIVDDDEKKVLNGWLNKAQTISKLIINTISKKYEGFQTRLKAVIKDIEQYTEPNAGEPEETDADTVQKFDSPQHQITQHRAEQRLEKLAKDISSIKQEQSWYVQHGKPYFGLKPEDVSKTAMQEIANIFLGDSPKKDDANFLIQWAKKAFYAGKIDGGEKKQLVAIANAALSKLEQKGQTPLIDKTDSNTELAENSNSLADDVIAQVHADTPVGGNYGNSEIADNVIAQIHEETPVKSERK